MFAAKISIAKTSISVIFEPFINLISPHSDAGGENLARDVFGIS